MRTGIAAFFRRLADRLQPLQPQPGQARGLPSRIAAPGAEVEELELPEIGPCVVRGLLLRDRLLLATQRVDGYENAARMLAFCVLTRERAPIFDAEGWEVYGTRHYEACVEALNRAQRLSGMLEDQAEAEKKS